MENVMGEQAFSVLIREVSLIDIEELSQEVPPSDLDVVQPGSGDDSHNELATLLILTLTPAALTAVTAWLLRTSAGEVVNYRVTIRSPDGTEMDVQLKIKRHTSEAPKSQIIKQIADALKLPEDAILQASAG